MPEVEAESWKAEKPESQKAGKAERRAKGRKLFRSVAAAVAAGMRCPNSGYNLPLHMRGGEKGKWGGAGGRGANQRSHSQ